MRRPAQLTHTKKHCPFMTLNCHLTTGFPLISPSCPFHVSHDVLVMSLPCLSTPPSCPCHFLGISASFSMHVPFFRRESFPYISRRADWLPCPLFPFHSPCTPLVFISVPFSFPLVPFHFSVAFLSCRLPISSAFPLCSPAFSAKKH